jgi:NAD-dependent deacetylase
MTTTAPAAFPPAFIHQLRHAQRVVALTGAGVSAESGVPTFRDALTGLWARFRPEELATPEAFRRDPKLVWEWYAWRREKVRSVEPNDGHRALAALSKRIPEFTLVTQNVDGLHQRSGSGGVLELHGSLLRVKCFQEDVVVPEWTHTEEVPPRCPQCHGPLRPDVVWFGESLPEDAWNEAARASAACQVFLSIGTSSLVYPAAALPEIALRNGATVVEINPDETPLTRYATHVLRGPSGTILPQLLQELSRASV